MGYSLRSWLRERIDYRDARRCAICGKGEPETHTARHHVFPRRDGGPAVLSNMITLCTDHHRQADEGRIDPNLLYEIVQQRNEELNWPDYYQRPARKDDKQNLPHRRSKKKPTYTFTGDACDYNRED